MVRRHLQWRHFLQMAAYVRPTIAAVIVAHQAAQQDCRAPCYVVQFGIGTWRQGTRHNLLSLRLVAARSLGWIGRVVCYYPPRTERRMEMIFFSYFPLVYAWGISMGISYIWKCKLNTLNMHGCVVYQKLPYLYMSTNACMLAAKACMHVALVFQELKI